MTWGQPEATIVLRAEEKELQGIKGQGKVCKGIENVGTGHKQAQYVHPVSGRCYSMFPYL